MTDDVDFSTAAADLVSGEAVFVDADATIREAARLMWERDIGLLVVGRPEQAEGVISERDVSSVVAQDHDPDQTTVGETMSGTIASAATSERAFELALEMLDLGTRHLAVEEDDRIVGVISLRDVIRPLVAGALEGDRPTSP